MVSVVQSDRAALLEAVRALAPLAQASAGQMESERRLPLPLVNAMVEAGLFRMCIPRSLGGLEVDPETFFLVVEAMATAEGAAGWCLFVGAASGLQAAYLPDSAAREIYGGDPRIVTCGVYAAKGKALPVPGGFHVTGRWPLASGCQHSAWLACDATVMDGDNPRLLDGGAPEMRLMYFRAGQCQILDTWHSTGLRGSGSHDVAVDDLFVPEEHSFPLFAGRSSLPGPLYRGFVGRWQGAAAAGAATGIARSALTAFVELAATKVPSGQRTELRNQGFVQSRVAQAEALLRSGRAFLLETIRDAWETVLGREEPTLDQEMLMSLAARFAVDNAVEAVELLYRAAGSSAVYSGSRLDRCMRDVHTVCQHSVYSPAGYERAGRVFLGLPADPPAA
jgi:alkylation response protein AidB-like acyl-CoA dehydrogenase